MLAESRGFLRDQIPLARRVLGDDHDHTLGIRATYAHACGLEAISKGRTPRRETLDTLEDVYTRSKRVFGPTHPFTQNARGKILDLS